MATVSDLYATPTPTPSVIPISNASGLLDDWVTPALSNPMTTDQDIIVGGVGGTPGRLGVGPLGYVLTVGSGGVVDWEPGTGGFLNPMTTSQDLIVGGLGGAPARLGVGTVGQVLTVGSGGIVDWATPAGGGSGTVNSGTATQFAYYPASSAAVSSTPTLTVSSVGRLAATPTAVSSGVVPYLTVTAPADTALTAGTEAIGVSFVGAIRQHASNTSITSQREFVFAAPTYSFASATGTITNAATVTITAAPTVGTNAAITNPFALWLQAGNLGFGASGSIARISSASGALTLTASGTNQNVTFTPSGTGSVVVASAFVGIGTGATAVPSHLTVVDEVTVGTRGIILQQSTSDAAGCLMNFRKTRGTFASPTTVANSDYGLSLGALHYTGSAFLTNAFIGSRIAGTVTSTSCPTDIFISTSAANDTDPYTNGSVRVIVKSAGRILMGTTTDDGTSRLQIVGDFAVSTGGIGVGIAPSSSAFIVTGASTTGVSGIRLTQGAAPSSPVNGDCWMTSAGFFYRANGVTVGPVS